MTKTQELAQKLQSAMEINERIHNAKREIVYQKAEIATMDKHIKMMMLETIIKEQRVEALNRELDNAVEIDIQAIQKEIEELG